MRQVYELDLEDSMAQWVTKLGSIEVTRMNFACMADKVATSSPKKLHHLINNQYNAAKGLAFDTHAMFKRNFYASV